MKNKTSELEEFDFNKMEDVNVNIDKIAFSPKSVTCSKCKLKMKKKELQIEVDTDIFVKLHGFECTKCHKQYLGLEEAKRMDKAFIISRINKKGFSMERNLSFDGDNYIFRIPKEFTKDICKRKIEVTPLGAKQFCATIL